MRETNYRYLEPKIIAEEPLSESGQGTPRGCKIFCFKGKPVFIQVDSNRFSGHARSLFSPQWHELDFDMEFPRNPDPPERFANLDDMLQLSARVSADFSFIRVDFFQLDGRVVIGELTNIPAAACLGSTPDQADLLASRLFADPAVDVEALFGVRAACAS